MKKVLVLFLVVGFLLTGITTVVAAPPHDITIDVTQDQCRYYPDGMIYHDHAPLQTSFELRLTGNALHGEMEYSPLVEPVRANKFVLVNRGYDADKNGYRWVLRMGSPHYPSYYCPELLINEYWEGYLILDADFNLLEGQFIQIGYTSTEPAKVDCTKYPFAVKGVPPKRGLWCLGWSTYDYTPPSP